MADKVLKETVENIKILREDASLPVENWDPKTRPGIEMRRRVATEMLPVAVDGYKRLLAARMLSVLVTGPGAGGFAETAEGEFGCVAVRADALYEDLADKIAPSLRPGERFGVEQVVGINLELEDIGRRLGIMEMPAPQISGDLVVAVNDRRTLVTLIQTAIERAVDGDLNRMYTVDKAASKAADTLYDLPVLPVVFFSERPFGFPAYSPKSFMVGIGSVGAGCELGLDKVTKDTVKSALVAAQRKFGMGKKEKAQEAPGDTDK